MTGRNVTRAWEAAIAHAPMTALAWKGGAWQYGFADSATAEQRAAAIAAVEALEWSEAAFTAWRAATIRATAKALYQEFDALPRLVRALALVMLDEINLLRAQHGLAPRTAAQLRAAIEARIDQD